MKVLNFGIVASSNGSTGDGTRRFGLYELDLRAGELRRQGMKVKLQEQPFQVLAQLLERPGEVVTREQLRNRLWSADTFVDFDHSLNAAIRRLRDALGDSAESPRFVETVARRGYRFLAPVNSGNGNGDQLTAIESQTQPRSRFHVWWILAGAGAIVLLLLGLKLGLLLGQHPPVAMRVSQLTANPPTTASGRLPSRTTAAISPSPTKPVSMFVRLTVEKRTPSPCLRAWRPLPSDGFPTAFAWLLPWLARARQSSLWEISALGGSGRKLIDDGRSPAVSPDGREIAFLAGKRLREELWVVGADGSQPHKLVGHEGDMFGAVAWSPDGTRIACTRASIAYGYGAKGAIEIVDLKGEQAGNIGLPVTSVLSLAGLDGPLAWSSDGRLIYSLLEPRPRQLDSNLWSVALDRQSKPILPPVRLTNDPGAVLSVNTSGDSRRIVYRKGIPQPDVYIAKLQGSSIFGEPQRLTLDDRQDLPFDWTSDSKAVIYMSDRSGTFKIYKQAADQAVPDVLVAGNKPVAQPRLSSDGTQLLYVVYPNWGEKASAVPLMRVPIAGGTPQEIVKAAWITNHQCSREPSSVCIYSVMAEGQLTLFTFDPFQGKGSQLSSDQR